MPRRTVVPESLRYEPFRGRDAIMAGLVTRDQLAGAGYQRLYRGVYLETGRRVDHLIMCKAAALLLPPDAALSHRSAAMLHTVNLLGRDQPVEATAPVGVRSRPGLRVVRSALAPDERWRRGGLPVTGPLRTAVDLARQPDLRSAVVGLDAMLYHRLITPEKVRARLAAPWPTRLAGVHGATRALTLARPFVESPMETLLRLEIVLDGLPEPLVQYEVRDGRFAARLDLAYPRIRLALEYDGDHHRERSVFRRDAVRLNQLRLMGWTVLRFTADDVLRNPTRMLAQIRAAVLTLTRNAA